MQFGYCPLNESKSCKVSVFTIGSEAAPVQRAKQIRGWGLGRPNFVLILCLSCPDLFLKAADTIVSSHCKMENILILCLVSFRHCISGNKGEDDTYPSNSRSLETKDWLLYCICTYDVATNVICSLHYTKETHQFTRISKSIPFKRQRIRMFVLSLMFVSKSKCIEK